MQEKIELLKKANYKVSEAKASLLTAQFNRSIVRHSLREHYRQQAAVAGEKITEARLDDLSTADEKYQQACQSEVNAAKTSGDSEAEAKKALCDYEVALAMLSAQH